MAFKEPYKNTLDKPFSLQDYERILGCGFKNFFKTLMLGITVKNCQELCNANYSTPEEKYVDFIHNEIQIKNYTPYFYNNMLEELQINFGNEGEFFVYVKDYGKTWWVRGEKNE